MFTVEGKLQSIASSILLFNKTGICPG